MILIGEDVTKGFAKEEEALDFFKLLDEKSIWKKVYSNELEAVGLLNTPILLEDIKAKTPFSAGVSDDSILETIQSVGLAIRIPTEAGIRMFPLASSGIISILQRAGFGPDSSSLRRTKDGKDKSVMDPQKKALVLNYGFEISTENCLVYIQDEKIRSIHSSEYVRLPFSELTQIFKERLQNQFDKVFFAESTVNYMFSTIGYLVQNKEIEKNIISLFERHGIDVSTMKLMVRLISSDIGESGANIYPCLISPTKYIALGKPLSTTHKDNHTMKDFAENVDKVVSMFKDSTEQIDALGKIRLKHPAGCLLRLAKQCGLSKRIACEKAEEFEGLFGATATFIDAWWELNDIYDEMNEKTPDGKRITLQEQIARVIFSANVAEYDIPFQWE